MNVPVTGEEVIVGVPQYENDEIMSEQSHFGKSCASSVAASEPQNDDESDTKTFHCNMCSRSFTQLKKLSQHMLLHSKKKT